MRTLFLLILIFVGCAQKSENKNLPCALSPTEIQISQAKRTSEFYALVGRGVVEFRWTDDTGKHREQGELDFWKQGDAISLRVSKLGELLLWFGGDRDGHWLFDMLGEETSLTFNGNNGMFSDITTALVLLGLAPLPSGTMHVDRGVVTLVDDGGSTWTATFDPASHRPLEISVRSDEDVSSALHRTGIKVELANRHEIYWPVTGGIIDVTDTRGDTEIKIAFSTLSTIVEEEPMGRVFDSAYLRKALKPDVIYQGKQR
mgnify:CR=1 FL=1